MKVRKNGLLISLMLSAAVAGLAGCSSSDSENKEQQAKADDVLTVAWPRDVAEMNPHVYNPSQMFAQTMVYEPLIGYGENGKLEPKLAESWDISEDGKTYTFHLRKDVKFSDGSVFNAEVVKRNFDEVLRQTKENGTHSWLTVLTKIKDVTVEDEQTVKMTLTEPYYAMLQELAVARPVRVLGDAGFPEGDDTSKGVKEAVGTGPWMLKEYKADDYAIFSRNDNYWGELPKVKEVKVKVIPDAETSALALEKGDIDLIIGEGALSTDTFKELEKDEALETQISEPYATRQLVMNTTRDTLSDIRVREALTMAFDKANMVETITAGTEEKADHILSTNMPYTANIKPQEVAYDQEKAAKLLDEAGWKLKDGATVREKDGKPLEIELMYNAAETIQKTMAETLQSEWATIGVQVNLVSEELANQIKRFKGDDFDINFFSNYGTPYDPHTFVNIVASKGFGYSTTIASYDKKAQLEKDIHGVLTSTDEEKRQDMYTAILTTLQDQYSIVPISYINKVAVYQDNVEGLEFAPNRDEHSFNDIELK
jgi:nickel transport system substrate-binding protein